MGIKISNSHKKGESVFERLFFCPGCGNAHGFRSKEWPEPKGLSDEDKKFFKNKWTWNGNMEKPTLSPSVHVQKKIGVDSKNNPVYETLCHSFVKDGMIQFLNDSKHRLKGKIVELLDI